jgi:hypothetical protein
MDDHAYSQKQWFWAVNLCALTGWSFVFIPISIEANSGTFFLNAFILGLPFVAFVCWIFVAPILRTLMKRQFSWFRAAQWGFFISSAISVLSIVLGRLIQWFDTSSNSQLGGNDKTLSTDGILTPLGWFIVGYWTIAFMLLCIIVALVVRAAIGPGKPQSGRRQPNVR